MGLVWNGVAMGVLGFCVAIPDTSLGAVATQDVCERHGTGAAVLTTALSLTNGIGGMGPILQGSLTPLVANTYGWPGVFRGAAALLCLGAVVLLPVALDEKRGMDAKRSGKRAEGAKSKKKTE